ncbi:MAG: efflux RND transporter permease subunit [Pedosphaera sp.]|nr:efflux RND transporter permease subunit [Pedosphaera sp.]
MNALIAWFARNGVAANLLMIFIILMGVNGIVNRLPVEVFPQFAPDEVEIRVTYRGATPEQMEESVAIPLENIIADLPGIEEIKTSASEGSVRIEIEVETGHAARDLLEDVKSRVDSINSLPEGIEPPVIRLEEHLHEVVTLIIHGDMSEYDLRKLGERIRDEAGRLEGVSRVKMRGLRNYEIGIEISEHILREHGLTLQQVAEAVRDSAVDIPGGVIQSRNGEVLVRTEGRAFDKAAFEKIVIKAREDGSHLTLGEITTVTDAFEEDRVVMRFNGRRCAVVHVARTGDQNALEIEAAVQDYLERLTPTLPKGVNINIWNNRADIIHKRLSTLNDSALMGCIFIVVLLGLFLRPAVAMWVCVGVPVAFMGAFALMPYLGVTINLFTLYGFLLVLGVLVDDAIVTGERIHAYQQRGGTGLEGAIKGAQEVAIPVIFGVLTTAIAFVPLLMVEGRRGQIFAQIPLVIIPCLLFSLIESKLILPAHLSHLSTGKPAREKLSLLGRGQRWFADGLEWGIDHIYRPILAKASTHRYVTLCLFIAAAVTICSYSFSGRMQTIYFPPIDSEMATARLVMPQGTAYEVTEKKLQKMIHEGKALQAKYTAAFTDPKTGETAPRSLIGDIITTIGGQNIAGVRGGPQSGIANLGEVQMQLMAPEDRVHFRDSAFQEIKTRNLVAEWRKNIGVIEGAQEITTRGIIGRTRDPIAIKLAMPAQDTSAQTTSLLTEVAGKLKAELATYTGLFDIHDTFERTKEEVRPTLKPGAMQRGLTRAMVGRQVQGGFFGHEAQRIQRGQNEVRVMVRYPLAERQSMANLENMHIRTPEGASMPLASIADLEMAESYPYIRRSDLARTLYVIADADKFDSSVDLEKIREDIEPKIAALVAKHPGMSYEFVGESRERAESFAALKLGGIIVLLGIYAMLAIPFKSYLQPLIVMAIIPFSIMGALLGHMIMDVPFSIMSAFGLLAMGGVVVNDSLVMVHYINLKRKEGTPLLEAVRNAGAARFRPIILTSLTTFGGILPTMFEKSTQAQFVIPMGISLAWGVLFATFITLILVPICYLILEDTKSGLSRYWNWQMGRKPEPTAA